MRLDKSAQNSAFKNRHYDDDEQKAKSERENKYTHIIILFPKIPPFSLLNLNET
jgi:hypothetical protein